MKAERARLTELASISESQLKQCEVIIARADQLTRAPDQAARPGRAATPCCTGTSRRCRPTCGASSGRNSSTAVQTLSAALAAWGREGLSALGSGEQDLTALAVWAVVTVALWWLGRFLRRRFGRGA